MFAKEWFPYCYVMGITWDEFWNMNPRIVNAYKEGFRLKREEDNAFAYLQGVYFRDAIASTIGNVFKKKGAKAAEYPSKPYDLSEGATDDNEYNSGALTEAEKRRKTEMLFGTLRLMQANYELSKQQDKRESE